MTRSVTIEVKRDSITESRILESEVPSPQAGQVVVAIDKFALTANNVTYAVAGDMVGYWQFYPSEDPWGTVPVWGIGEVLESQHDGVAVGERLYGFFPMASHALLTLDADGARQYREVSDHRKDLPPVYNNYVRTATDPEFLQSMEDERCIYFPLFMTSYLIYDFLVDNGLFDAGQVVIGSASSKTAFGLAGLLHGDPEVDARVVGLTSTGNRAFVEGLGYYDQVVSYGDENELDAHTRAVYVDMSGNGALTAKVHGLLQDRLAYSCAVGATHWESFGSAGELPGPEPEFFFAPAQIEKREQEWGRGVIMSRAGEAVAGLVQAVSGGVEIQRLSDPEVASSTWTDLVENRVPPSRGLMLSLLP